MTVHIAITLFVLIICFLIQRSIYNKKWGNTFQSLMNNVIIFALLPLSFSSITVVANFLFEAFGDNILWFSVIYIPLWIINIIYSIKIIQRSEPNRWQFFWTIIMGIISSFWYITAITQSHYESGLTPKIGDSIYTLFYLLSIHIVLVFIFIIQFSMWQLFRIARKIFTILLSVIYVAIVWDIISRIKYQYV